MTTLTKWSRVQTNPEGVFTGCLSDIIRWCGLPVTTTTAYLWEYLLYKYGDIACKDYNISALTRLTALWHTANYYKFEGLAATTTADYNPIENYNRTETETVERTPDLTTETTTTETPRVVETETTTHTPQTTETETHNLTATEGGTTGTATTEQSASSADTTGKVAPYDSALFSNAAESVGSTSGSGSASETVTHGKTLADTGTVTRATTGTDTTQKQTSATGTNTNAETREETGTDTTERETHISGNIGVTTSQEMLKQEREIVNFVMLDEYLTAWVNAFCVGIWI